MGLIEEGLGYVLEDWDGESWERRKEELRVMCYMILKEKLVGCIG